MKLAVLIDGDNIPSAYITEMMEEIAKYGNPTIKRIYGDWTKPTSPNGKTCCWSMPSIPFSNTAILPGKTLLILP